MINQIALLGAVNSEVDSKTVKDFLISSFTLKAQSGSQNKPKDIEVKVTTFGKIAEIASSFVLGDLITVSGRLDVDYFANNNGVLFIVGERVAKISNGKNGVSDSSTIDVNEDKEESEEIPF